LKLGVLDPSPLGLQRRVLTRLNLAMMTLAHMEGGCRKQLLMLATVRIRLKTSLMTSVPVCSVITMGWTPLDFLLQFS